MGEKMFCINCGKELPAESRFCNYCGTPVPVRNAHSEKTHSTENGKTEGSNNNSKRQTTYEGVIHKCPNCGELIESFTSNCPACGHEFRDTSSSRALKEFAEKLEAIEATRGPTKRRRRQSLLFSRLHSQPITDIEERKVSLIRSFTIPNTKEDLYEFLIMSSSNIDFDSYDDYSGGIYRNNRDDARRYLSDAWLAKFEQAYHKAKLVFADDPRLIDIQALYDKTTKRIKWAKAKIWVLAGASLALILIMFLFVVVIPGITHSNKTDVQQPTVHEVAPGEPKTEDKNVQTDIKDEVVIETPTDNEKSGYDINDSDPKQEEALIDVPSEDEKISFKAGDIVVDLIPNENIQIDEVGFWYSDNYLQGIIFVSNPKEGIAVAFPTVRVTAYNQDNAVLGTEDIMLGVVYPQKQFLTADLLMSVSECPYRIDVTAIGPQEDYWIMDVNDLRYPNYEGLVCQNITVDLNHEKITGQVFNPNDFNIDDAPVIAVFKDSSGTIVSSYYTYVFNITATKNTPFEIGLPSDAVTTDNVELYAEGFILP